MLRILTKRTVSTSEASALSFSHSIAVLTEFFAQISLHGGLFNGKVTLELVRGCQVFVESAYQQDQGRSMTDPLTRVASTI